MGRELVYVCIQPQDKYYIWQVNMWLESCKTHGIFNTAEVHILLYKPDGHAKWYKEWKALEDLYPEAKFFRYEDRGIRNLLHVYIPLLRPHTLAQHFRQHTELSKKAILYHDCDIILNKPLDIAKYLDDDVAYVSDTIFPNDYMSHKYFESKGKDVEEAKREEYKNVDVLAEAGAIVGISKETIVSNYENTGGAQYLLKNIDYTFWEKVQKDSIEMVLYLKSINRRWFESEEKGIQSWCSDMWAVLWNIWKRGGETKIAKEMDFCWATDVIEKLQTHPILHMAGVMSSSTIRTRIEAPDGSGKIHVDAPAFYKGRYYTGSFSPFNDEEYLQNILNNDISKQYCFYKYVEMIEEVKNKYYTNN